MKIRLPHAPYIANKIAIDLLNSGFVTLKSGLEPVVKTAEDLVAEGIRREMALEERVEEILDENEDDMEFMQVDVRSMFWLIKKKIAKEYDVTLSYEDRYNDLAHIILEKLWKSDLIEYSISENRAKNIIYLAIEKYISGYSEVEDIVSEKINDSSRNIVPGSPEYDLIYERLYEEELRKKGLFL